MCYSVRITRGGDGHLLINVMDRTNYFSSNEIIYIVIYENYKYWVSSQKFSVKINEQIERQCEGYWIGMAIKKISLSCLIEQNGSDAFGTEWNCLFYHKGVYFYLL